MQVGCQLSSRSSTLGCNIFMAVLGYIAPGTSRPIFAKPTALQALYLHTPVKLAHNCFICISLKHTSGQWSVVSGQWSVVSGQWSGVSGQWSVVSGQWSVNSGQWSVFCSYSYIVLIWFAYPAQYLAFIQTKKYRYGLPIIQNWIKGTNQKCQQV